MAKRKDATEALGTQVLYLCQFSYTAEAWKQLLAKPDRRDRAEAVHKLVEKLGGCFPRIEIPCGDWQPGPREKFVTFGDRDVAVLLAFPGDTAMAAFAMAISAGGAITNLRTTKLMPWAQAMQAMDAASKSQVTYVAPQA